MMNVKRSLRKDENDGYMLRILSVNKVVRYPIPLNKGGRPFVMEIKRTPNANGQAT
jgi:hypothetical protein